MNKWTPKIVDGVRIMPNPDIWRELSTKSNTFNNTISGKKVQNPNERFSLNINKKLFRNSYLKNCDCYPSDFDFSIYAKNYFKAFPEEKKITLPRWKHLRRETKAQYYQLALSQSSNMLTFTVNFTPELLLKLIHSEDITRTLRRSFAYQLKYLDIDSPYWFALDITDHYLQPVRPHIHGSIDIQEKDRKRFRLAMQRLNKKVDPRFSSHLVLTKRPPNNKISTSTNWAAYSLKHHAAMKLFYLHKSIRGNLITASHELTRSAKVKYGNFKQTKKMTLSS